MKRRKFLSRGLSWMAGEFSTRIPGLRGQTSTPGGPQNPQFHRLPVTDAHYQRVRSYVEDTPIPEYRWASEQAYEAFRDTKYGVRIHWGIYSLFGFERESWPYLRLSNQERQGYDETYKTWNPKSFDAREWMNLFAESGMQMFAFTTKHHEGFSMYDTKTRVKRRVNWIASGGPLLENCDLAYSIMETPFRRDIVKELCNAAHERDIKIDLYFSHPDWYDADFRPYVRHPAQVPSAAKLTGERNVARRSSGDNTFLCEDPTAEETQRMLARHRAQLLELLTNYGTIDMLSLDMVLGPIVWPQLRDTILQLRKTQPNVMLRNRGIGNYGDYYTPEGFVPGSKEDTGVPWMVIYPLGSGFSYDAKSENYKGAGWIVNNLVDAVAKGGSLQVGIGPDASGRFHPTAVAQLREAGAWLRVNGEGIYGTRPRDGALWSEGSDIRYTRSKDGKTVYAFSLNWPGESLQLKAVRARTGTRVRMLGTDRPLVWRGESQGMVIELPSVFLEERNRPCRFAYGFKIEV